MAVKISSLEARALRVFIEPRATTGGGTQFRTARVVGRRVGSTEAMAHVVLTNLKTKGMVAFVSLEESRLAGFKTAGKRFRITRKGYDAVTR